MNVFQAVCLGIGAFSLIIAIIGTVGLSVHPWVPKRRRASQRKLVQKPQQWRSTPELRAIFTDAAD